MPDKLISVVPRDWAYLDAMCKAELASLGSAYGDLLANYVADCFSDFISEVYASVPKKASVETVGVYFAECLEKSEYDELRGLITPPIQSDLLKLVNYKLFERDSRDLLNIYTPKSKDPKKAEIEAIRSNAAKSVEAVKLRIQTRIMDGFSSEQKKEISQKKFNQLHAKESAEVREKYEKMKGSANSQLVLNLNRYGTDIGANIQSISLDNQSDLIVNSALRMHGDQAIGLSKIVPVLPAKAIWLGILPVISDFAGKTSAYVAEKLDIAKQKTLPLANYEEFLKNSLDESYHLLNANSGLNSVVFGGLSIDMRSAKGGHYEYFELRRMLNNMDEFELINVNSIIDPRHPNKTKYTYDAAEKAVRQKYTLDRVKEVAEKSGFKIKQVICHHLYTQTGAGCGPAYTETMLQRLLGTREYPATTPIEDIPMREAHDLSTHFRDANGLQLNREEVARLQHASLIAHCPQSAEQQARLCKVAADDGSSCALKFVDEVNDGAKLPPSKAATEAYWLNFQACHPRSGASELASRDEPAFEPASNYMVNPRAAGLDRGIQGSSVDIRSLDTADKPRYVSNGDLPSKPRRRHPAPASASVNCWWYLRALAAVVLAVVAVVAFVVAMIAANAATGGMASVAIVIASTLLLKTSPLILGVMGGVVAAVTGGAAVATAHSLNLFAPKPRREEGVDSEASKTKPSQAPN